jgi:hypothetical protein
MITERDEERTAGRGALFWSFLASAILNLLIWATATSSFDLSFLRKLSTQEPHQELLVVSSSAIRIERRTIPQPQSVPRISRAVPVRRPRVQPQPKEIARAMPSATPQPQQRKRERQQSLASQLAAQEAMFAQEAARLNAQRSPISIATVAPQPPATYQRSFMDLNGAEGREQVEALLLPRQHWFTTITSCYYVHYYAQWSGGGSEEGNIPWPVCYPRDHDAMLPLNRPHVLPVPAPPVGYVLPPGTELTPLLREIYDGEIRN